jgi:hypothetical protein
MIRISGSQPLVLPVFQVIEPLEFIRSFSRDKDNGLFGATSHDFIRGNEGTANPLVIG